MCLNVTCSCVERYFACLTCLSSVHCGSDNIKLKILNAMVGAGEAWCSKPGLLVPLLVPLAMMFVYFKMNGETGETKCFPEHAVRVDLGEIMRETAGPPEVNNLHLPTVCQCGRASQ